MLCIFLFEGANLAMWRDHNLELIWRGLFCHLKMWSLIVPHKLTSSFLFAYYTLGCQNI